MKKALVLGLLVMLLFSGLAMLSPGAHGVETRALNLTEKYSWNCDANPSGITLATSDPSTSTTASITHTYTTNASWNRTYVDIHLKEDNASDYNNTYLSAVLPYAPGVQTIEGYLYMPEQTGVVDMNIELKLQISLGGGAAAAIIFHRTPGMNDEVMMYNGAAGSNTYWGIPRIRNTWVHFIFSVNTDSTSLYYYVQFSTDSYYLSKTYSMPVGPATLEHFNLMFNSAAYTTDVHLYLDDLHWYQEYYTADEKMPQFQNSQVYYKGLNWQDKVWVWELTWDQKVGGDADITKSPYISLLDYTQNYTTSKVIAFINQTDYNKQINATLNHTEFKEIMFGGYSGIISYPSVLRAVSWAAKHDTRVKGFIFDDYSSFWGSTGYTLTDYTNAKNALQTYAAVPVYGMIYTHNYNNLNTSAWNLLNGAFLSGWFGGDYATAIDTLYSVATSHFATSNIYIVLYTHLYGESEGYTPESQHAFFEKYGEYLKDGKIAGIVAIGPARFLNYNDNDYKYQTEANEYFAKQMALSYSSDGRTINVYKEWDGTYLNFSKIAIPKLTNADSYKIVSHANVQVELEIPSNWDYNNVQVIDETIGRTINWQKGSVIFAATAGHTYTIEEVIQSSVNTAYAIVPMMFSLIIIMLIFSIIGGLMKSIGKAFKGGRGARH